MAANNQRMAARVVCREVITGMFRWTETAVGVDCSYWTPSSCCFGHNDVVTMATKSTVWNNSKNIACRILSNSPPLQSGDSDRWQGSTDRWARKENVSACARSSRPFFLLTKKSPSLPVGGSFCWKDGTIVDGTTSTFWCKAEADYPA